MNDNLKNLQRLIKRKETLIQKHLAEQAILKDKLRTECTHEDTTEEREYWEGSYFDKAETLVRTKCLICGKILNSKRIVHDWYG